MARLIVPNRSVALLCILLAGPAFAQDDADEVEARPPREAQEVWSEVVRSWSEFEKTAEGRPLDIPRFDRMDEQLQAVSDGLVELNLSIGSLKQNWDTRERIRLQNATKFMWADLAQLRVVVYKQIPGSFPSLVDPVRRRLFTLQDRFPEGTLKPPLLPKPQSIIDGEERKRARQAQAGAQP